MAYSTTKRPNTWDENIVLASGHTLTSAGGAGALDFHSATGTFKTSTGTNTLYGDVVINGAKTFTTGTGAVSIKADMTFDSGKDIVMQGAGEFTSGTGAVALNGDITVASGKDILMQGAAEFTSGTGAVALNGDITVASGKDILMQGAAEFTSGTGAVALNGDITVASGKDILMQGAGEFTTGTGAVAINGNATVATAKTLAVTDADALTVGGLIVPQLIPVNFAFGSAVADGHFFIANDDFTVVSMYEIHSTAGNDGGGCKLMVERTQTTEAPGAGDSLLTNNTNTGFDLNGTANTLQTGSLTATVAHLNLAAGDRLTANFTGNAGTLAGGVLTVYLKRI